MNATINLNINNIRSNSFAKIIQELQRVENKCDSQLINAAHNFLFHLLLDNGLELEIPYIGTNQAKEPKNATLSLHFIIRKYFVIIFIREGETEYLVQNNNWGFEKWGELKTQKQIQKFTRLIRSLQNGQIHQDFILF